MKRRIICRILAPEIFSATFKFKKRHKIETKSRKIECKDVDATDLMQERIH
jgi:hypothetical protein